MEGLQLIVSTVIAFSASISFLSLVFYALLDPVKKDIANLEGRLDKLEAGQARLSADIAEIKQLLAKP